jgi:hypothetical protein
MLDQRKPLGFLTIVKGAAIKKSGGQAERKRRSVGSCHKDDDLDRKVVLMI